MTPSKTVVLRYPTREALIDAVGDAFHDFLFVTVDPVIRIDCESVEITEATIEGWRPDDEPGAAQTSDSNGP